MEQQPQQQAHRSVLEGMAPPPSRSGAPPLQQLGPGSSSSAAGAQHLLASGPGAAGSHPLPATSAAPQAGGASAELTAGNGQQLVGDAQQAGPGAAHAAAVAAAAEVLKAVYDHKLTWSEGLQLLLSPDLAGGASILSFLHPAPAPIPGVSGHADNPQQQHHHQQQQQQEEGQEEEEEEAEQQQQQPHDLYSMLSLVLASLPDLEGQRAACAVHRASRRGRRCAVGTIQRLSLARYDSGLYYAQSALEWITEEEVAPAALARAAAAPLIPWGLLADLAAAGTLTFLEIRAQQASRLLAGPPTAAAAEAVPGVVAMLSHLRSLKVIDYDLISTEEQLQDVDRLVGACSSLTRLELEASYFLTSVPELSKRSGSQVSMDLAPQISIDSADAVAQPGSPVACNLQHLQHLVLLEGKSNCAHGWLDGINAAKLTTVELQFCAASSFTTSRLAACTGLQELKVVGAYVEWFEEEEGVHEMLEQLQHLPALTKLQFSCHGDASWDEEQPVPPGVWQLTALRHLDLSGICWDLWELPQEFSSLRQLTLLDITTRCYPPDDVLEQDLPHQLGAWLPQLQVLNMGGHMVQSIPDGLGRLTRLDATGCQIHSLSAVQHVVQLRQLCIPRTIVRPPCDCLTKLSALEVLELTFGARDSVAITRPLPRLQWLSLNAANPVLGACQLLGAAQRLTFLDLAPMEQDQVEALGQLGVLPALQQLELHCDVDTTVAAAGAWLQQQPQLTSFVLKGINTMDSTSTAPVLGLLPLGLLSLELSGEFVLEVVGEAVTQLASLKCLRLSSYNDGMSQQLPMWLTCLKHLEEFSWWGLMEGHTVLQELPLLRRITRGREQALHAAAPHLCWSKQL